MIKQFDSRIVHKIKAVGLGLIFNVFVLSNWLKDSNSNGFQIQVNVYLNCLARLSKI